MADVIDYKIYGEEMQVVEVELDPGEAVRAEVGAMLYMEPGIQMQTSTGGGIFAGFKRMITGAGFFISNFVNQGTGKQRVGFSAPFPGKIIPLDLGKIGGQFICQKHAFLCAASGTDIEIAFTKKLGAGLFGLSLADVTETQWETVLKQAELESRNELMADIGLGWRLAAVVASGRYLVALVRKPCGPSQPGEWERHGSKVVPPPDSL